MKEQQSEKANKLVGTVEKYHFCNLYWISNIRPK